MSQIMVHECSMENKQNVHSDGVCLEIFFGKKIKLKLHASFIKLDFMKKSDEKQVFLLEWPNEHSGL